LNRINAGVAELADATGLSPVSLKKSARSSRVTSIFI